jgi:hypothetical protein
MPPIRITITPEHHQQAQTLSDTRPIYRQSHRGKEANDVGSLGEIIAIQWLAQNQITTNHDDVTTHDLSLPNHQTIEIKTKDRTVAPQPHYECSIPLYNHDHQQPHYYLFVSIQRNKQTTLTGINRYHTAHILGAASQKQVNENAITRDTGWTDKRNDTTFWTACRNLTIKQLVNPQTTLASWQQLTPPQEQP